jgi:hypothetical protein
MDPKSRKGVAVQSIDNSSHESETLHSASSSSRHPLIRQFAMRTLLFVGVIIGIGVLIYGGEIVYSQIENTIQSRDTTDQLHYLEQTHHKLTAADLQSLDKNDLFYAVFQKAATEQRTLLTSASYFTKNTNEAPVGSTDYLVGFNYHTKQSTFASTTYGNSTTPTSLYRCIGMHGYNNTTNSVTGWYRDTSESPCNVIETEKSLIGDGFNTGGLSENEAANFVGNLRGIPNLVNILNMNLVSVNNQQYIRLDIAITPTNNAGSSVGMGNFESAFSSTNLNPHTWPYTSDGSLSEGAYLLYYINPRTQLPVYSQAAFPPSSPNGLWYVNRVQYAFPNNLPVQNITNTQPVTMSWPKQTF